MVMRLSEQEDLADLSAHILIFMLASSVNLHVFLFGTGCVSDYFVRAQRTQVRPLPRTGLSLGAFPPFSLALLWRCGI